MVNPTVSVICPIRNEKKHIQRCLESIIGQNFPANEIEILIVDGMSDDGTRNIVKKFAAIRKNVFLHDNPGKIVPRAMNIGIKKAKGKVIVRIDGHCYLERNFIAKSLKLLERVKDADCVGGPIITVSKGYVPEGISISMSSPFGVGDARFRYSQKEGYVDTLAFGAYRRQVFDRIGLFDEELVRNQDDEFNLRLIKSGGKIFLSPEIKSYYYSRSTLAGLWKQYFQYGYWKVCVIQKHKFPASWRHLVPGAFILSLICSFILAFFVKIKFFFFFGILAIYFIASFFYSFFLSFKNGWKYLPLLPVVFAILHCSYGFGFLTGLLKFSPRFFRS